MLSGAHNALGSCKLRRWCLRRHPRIQPWRPSRHSSPADHGRPHHHHQRAQHSLPAKLCIRSPHRPTPLFRLISAKSCRRSPGKICRPTHASLHELHFRPPPHQYNPCRGSSIGRACGSYDSKEINLKVEGSSPSFGYSYTKVPSGSCSFAFCMLVTTDLCLSLAWAGRF
jgi:hypothetical protein